GIRQRDADLPGDELGQLGVGRARDELQAAPWRGVLVRELRRRRGGATDHSCSCLRFSIRAGMPTAIVAGGTSRVTTAPAPVLAPRPTLTGALSIVSTPMNAPSSITVGFLPTPS